MFRYVRHVLAVLLGCALTATAALAVQPQAQGPLVRSLPGVHSHLPKDMGTQVIADEAALVKVFGEAAANKLLAQVDFTREKIVGFGWSGSSSSGLRHEVEVCKGKVTVRVWVRVSNPALADMRPHGVWLVLPREAAVAVVPDPDLLLESLLPVVAQDKAVKILADYKGGSPLKQDNNAWKYAPKRGVVANSVSWARLKALWSFDTQFPVDFDKEFLLVVACSGPNHIEFEEVTLSDKGDLRYSASFTEKGGPGFVFRVLKVSRAGVKTVNGQPLAD